jgi:hypothetical protein
MKGDYMKVVLALLLLILLEIPLMCYGQAASPAPGAVASVAVQAPHGISAWISSQGGLVAAVGVIVACLNIIMSALVQLFAKLAVAEPAWMQTVGSILLKISQYVTGNTPTPAPIVQAQLDAQKASDAKSGS